jgi:hypothetical protein
MQIHRILKAILAFSASVLATPVPSPSNYQLLVDEINAFQMESDYSFALISTALSTQKNLLNSFSINTVGNLTLFLPSDAGFLGLKIASLSQSELMQYFSCKILANHRSRSYRCPC